MLFALVSMALAPFVALLVAALLTPLPTELRERAHASASVRFFDRDGALLREVRADDASRAAWVKLDDLGVFPLQTLIAAEDRRFYDHRGVDPRAVLRAAASDLWHRRVVSGASTLTMQLARLVRPHRRDLAGKFAEMALALRIEATLSKRDILEEYANRAPFGPSVRGIDAAARYYFDKPPKELSLAEAATLAAIPRGPAIYQLGRHPERVQRRRDRILDRMLGANVIDAATHKRARAEPLVPRIGSAGFGAPHLVQALLDTPLDAGAGPLRGRAVEVTTTLLGPLQREAEAAVLTVLGPLVRRHVTAASVVALDNESGEVLAYVGSPDFFDSKRGGQNDGARAQRQPGSTLKPFVYGLAMERLEFTPATVLPDVALELATAGGTYAPLNYDERFHGPVRLRDALGNSLNVPAVWVAHDLGTGAVLERLRDVGFLSLREAPEHYGPGIALGDGEVTLVELAAAYATLARGGLARPLRFVRTAFGQGKTPIAMPRAEERRVLAADGAQQLTDVLADRHARLASFGERSALELPFAVAAKTGTSKGFRDNWAVGYTREVTVAVWVGNFDGTPMEGVSGITGAAPLFRAVIEAAMRGRTPAPLRTSDRPFGFERVAVCPLSGAAPGDACPHAVDEWLPHGHAPLVPCTMHVKVALDRRNGLRAGRACDPGVIEERRFERFDGRYAAWAHKAHRNVAPEAFSPLCPADEAHATGVLRIAYPLDGARFLLDPGRPRGHQALGVRVEAPPGVREVSLRVDGERVSHGGPPFVLPWPLAAGSHEIIAEARELGPSAPVRVRVE